MQKNTKLGGGANTSTAPRFSCSPAFLLDRWRLRRVFVAARAASRQGGRREAGVVQPAVVVESRRWTRSRWKRSRKPSASSTPRARGPSTSASSRPRSERSASRFVFLCYLYTCILVCDVLCVRRRRWCCPIVRVSGLVFEYLCAR